MQVDHTKHTLELVRLGWLVEIHDGKSSKYALTKHGLDSVEMFTKISKNPKDPSLQINFEKYSWMIKNGILVKHYDLTEKTEIISATPYGFGMFKTMEFWMDEKLQKKLVRRKKILDFLVIAKKNMDSFMKLANNAQPRTRSRDNSYGGFKN